MSIGVASLIAALMFFVWYPEPYRSLSGGLQLFMILVLVDVTLGPCATLVVSSPRKPAREWRTDMALVVLLQLAALGFGMWTVYQARPVYLAFEIDRFRTIHAVDVPASWLSRAPPGFQSLPILGPKRVAVRPFRDEQERINATLAALSGVFLGARPDLWMPYEDAVQRVLEEAKPIEGFLSQQPAHHSLILKAIEAAKLTQGEVLYLPLAGRQDFWTVLLNARTGEPFAYLPIDPYGP
ncbi:MAG: TfpX/TfpZ family type IV pilin accessory protein [Hydrogenophaga sp.]|uniref:TfpX/TfpZ family type IV pilin accessory protein n=1 Tax=Hydrogenophaga sp. TaxID=1904254 RepID=UPI0026349DF1|nr:TfpX/TfpZ family type IV pilin accessory protein [Hydrogenophaga sp.]MDM7944451.1 TfpX/TfpZ family type IV pilin accessory protein [Hydrogenophaga sp.]